MSRFTYFKPGNADYIDELYSRYSKDPQSVDPTWRYFFEGLEIGEEETETSHSNGAVTNGAHANGSAAASGKTTSTAAQNIDFSSEAKVADLINGYRGKGRLLSNLDPLSEPAATHPLLELANFKLNESDLDRTFSAGNLIGMGSATLRDIITRLRETYCSTIGFEYTHISDPVAREWIQDRLESSKSREDLLPDQRKKILQRLTESEILEKFIHTRYIAQKRFSVEGGESIIPALDRIIEVGADLGANNFVMGMAHRGRLNVLVNVYGKKPEFVFTEFEENYQREATSNEGDVKYHKGYSADIVTPNGKPVHLSLSYNPSHLEFVNPVVEGIARAKQRYLGDKERSQVIPVLIHGDAAFAGQGVVYETLNFSQIRGYWTGGTIHIVIDNQIGFTTDPIDSRSTTYSTDLAKMLEVPIFHVNGDDPEAVYFASRIATEYRQKFKKDVFIDLICYRKYGHNEGDEPSYTQPILYKKIKSKSTPRLIYAEKLAKLGFVSAEESKSLEDQVTQNLIEAQEITRAEKPRPYASAYADKWKDLHAAGVSDVFEVVQTQIPEDQIRDLSKKLNEFPAGFTVHRKLIKGFDARKGAVEKGDGIDWGNAETLAYASLLLDGHSIRLAGQDVERGTFTHRHAVLHDSETGKTYVPLNHLSDKQGQMIIRNSSLSESGVLGFEYGWSLADPHALVIWEAQFGDFANGAQVIIDQFIASAESKWQRASGIVLYLPHGYEGQGPEHSSARLERFLQLCGKQNMFVCNFTTPGQLFHALRRQLKRNFRKPMVVMTPKSLLRHPKAVSTLSELSQGQFHEVLDDPEAKLQPQNINRVLLCSGKIYYELLEEKLKSGRQDVAIVRMEQFYPFPKEKLKTIINSYSNAKRITWVQEEPRNMGGWTFIFNYWMGGIAHLAKDLGDRGIDYIGRDVGAAPAVGSHRLHATIQKEIVEKALSS